MLNFFKKEIERNAKVYTIISIITILLFSVSFLIENNTTVNLLRIIGFSLLGINFIIILFKDENKLNGQEKKQNEASKR
jgi:uncharacterized membrane protein